ncbi:unnamed protein product [Gadus morhua 'NCC']
MQLLVLCKWIQPSLNPNANPSVTLQPAQCIHTQPGAGRSSAAAAPAGGRLLRDLLRPGVGSARVVQRAQPPMVVTTQGRHGAPTNHLWGRTSAPQNPFLALSGRARGNICDRSQ